MRLARACVNLAGLRFGESARVDEEDPYIVGLIQGGLLQVIPEDADEDTASVETAAAAE